MKDLTYPAKHTRQHGFTLLEMVVVLALIAIIAGVALPNFARMAESYKQKAALGAVTTEISGLSFRAYSQVAPVRLSTESSRAVIASLPADWHLTVDKPIIIQANGFCSGGEAMVKAGNGATWDLTLVPPLCSVVSK